MVRRILVLLLTFTIIILAFPFGALRPAQAATLSACADDFCVYLPIIRKAPALDLTITALEITQAIQTPDHAVPLVANRRMVVRVFAQAVYSGGSGPTYAKVKLTAARGGVPLTGSFESAAVDIPTNPTRAVYGSTFNFTIPENHAWLNGSVDLTAAVDSAGQVVESDENNNALTQRVLFNSVANLKVMIVPVRYTHEPNGTTYSAPTADTISSKIKYMYPVANVEILWHSPLSYTGNLTQLSDLQELLYIVDALKSSDGQPSSTAYYGLVPAAWFSGGYVGIGFIGWRAAVGLDYWDATGTAAHEIGHNLGLYHAPCGNPSSVDPNYPYPNAQIGQYGVNVYTNTLIPYTRVDLMSYCDNEWISDYHYKKLYDNQRAYGADIAAPQTQTTKPVLLLRAVLSARGGAVFSPVYQLSGAADAPALDSPYHVRLLGADGKLLAEQGVQVYEVADLPVPEYHLTSRVALPSAAVARVQLWREDVLLAEQPLSQGLTLQMRPAAVVQAGQLTWSGDGGSISGPVLVRYSADGGITWQTLAVDAAGGTLELDPALQEGMFEILPALSW